MIEALKARVIADWRDALKWSSVRLHLLAVGIAAIYAVMPVLDPSIAAMLPEPLQAKAIGIYAVIGLVLRLTKLNGK